MGARRGNANSNVIAPQETPPNFRRIDLPGLTKWEIPDQLVENTAPACTMHCTSVLDNLNQRFATGFHDPRFSLTPRLAERITREAFAYGRSGYQRVEDS